MVEFVKRNFTASLQWLQIYICGSVFKSQYLNWSDTLIFLSLECEDEDKDEDEDFEDKDEDEEFEERRPFQGKRYFCIVSFT
jgi:hypothetical protein